MLVATAAGVVRAMGGLFRRADSGLALGAARNAAVGIAVRQARQLEDARTMRDLHRLELTREAGAEAGGARPRPGDPPT